MKAKELLKILQDNPEAEIIIDVYTGCLTPSISVGKAVVLNKNDMVNKDGGSFLTKEGKAKQLVILLQPDFDSY